MEDGLVQRRRALYKGGGTPPWKEAFRQRCVERLKSSRARLLERYRQLGEDVTCKAGRGSLVQEAMEMEWQALQTTGVHLPALWKQNPLAQVPEDPFDLAVLEEIQQELMLQEKMAIEEYERGLQFDEECLNAMLDGLDAEHLIICPVCQRSYLNVTSYLVVCQCGLQIGTQGMTEDKLRSLLEDGVTEHGHHCDRNPEFAITNGVEGETSLLMSCLACDSWTVIL
ncbi:RPA-interacting protein isoform X2 [Varanus komodoensis]|uniref:RPA interacting protein n=1 Tax=Varanus komodoensis TaxID=61221 RepID=A0A8D2Q6N5_VARKO|nr:RPA-interacting protein isoform X2 [Varanus komodoensis]